MAHQSQNISSCKMFRDFMNSHFKHTDELRFPLFSQLSAVVVTVMMICLSKTLTFHLKVIQSKIQKTCTKKK